MMTRKHFIQAAKQAKALDYPGNEKVWEQSVSQWENLFMGDNPRFDRERFRKAARK